MAMGVAGLIASPLGGKLSDIAAAANPAVPLARLTYNTAVSGLLLHCSLLLFGWAMQFKLHLAVILVAQFFIGAATCAYTPSLFGYLPAMKQQGAAAAAAGLHSTMFLASAVVSHICLLLLLCCSLHVLPGSCRRKTALQSGSGT
jgi:hypothetical protein